MTKAITDYALKVQLDVPYEEAVEKATAALKQEGFGVLTEIDVKDTLKKKLDAEFRKYVILGACNPPLAHKALSGRPEAGLMLPCNVTLEQLSQDSCMVRIINPEAMLRHRHEAA